VDVTVTAGGKTSATSAADQFTYSDGSTTTTTAASTTGLGGGGSGSGSGGSGSTLAFTGTSAVLLWLFLAGGVLLGGGWFGRRLIRASAR
jgi:hypothetical protein